MIILIHFALYGSQKQFFTTKNSPIFMFFLISGLKNTFSPKITAGGQPHMLKRSFSPKKKPPEASPHAKKEFFTKNNRRRPASQFSFPFPFSFWPGPGQDILFQKYPISSKNIHFLPKLIVRSIIKNGRFRSEKKDEGALCLDSGGRIKSH